MTKNQSSSTPQSTNLFTDLKQWRKQHASNTTPSKPRTTSDSTSSTRSLPALMSLSRCNSQHSIGTNRQRHRTMSTNEETESSLTRPSISGETYTSATATATTGNTTTSADMKTIDTTRIRLLPNVELASKCFVFDIIDRILTPTTILKIGRYSERHFISDRLAFKSKVVSRTHAELWMEKGNKIFIRDTGSSSGTFINRTRLSKSNEISQPMELRDGDIIQLGIDYQNEYQDVMDQTYRSVKIRLEINKDTNKINTFRRQAFLKFRQHFLDVSYANPSTYTLYRNNNSSNNIDSNAFWSEQFGDNHHQSNSKDSCIIGLPSRRHTNDSNHGYALEGQDHLEQNIINHDNNQNNTLQECCICLYSIAPLQALFIAPCSHGYHFKCLRPILLQHYPGFSCPLCRNYFDLEASVAEDIGSSTSTLNTKPTTSLELAPTSIISHYPAPHIHRHNQNHGTDTYDDNERRHEDTHGNIYRHILSSTTMDSSTMDQDGVHGDSLILL